MVVGYWCVGWVVLWLIWGVCSCSMCLVLCCFCRFFRCLVSSCCSDMILIMLLGVLCWMIGRWVSLEEVMMCVVVCSVLLVKM